MKEKRIAVLASGRGSNFRAILEKINEGYKSAAVGIVITNIPTAGVLEIAESRGIPVKIITPKNFPDSQSYNDEILKTAIQIRSK